MTNLNKLTKAQLIELIDSKENVLEEKSEYQWDGFKIAFGVTYNTEEEWIEFFKRIIAETTKKAQNELNLNRVY
tara:strand:+ start:360 stop:581 length:222 start_codon:yes stop_codon:yes gene_type:complete